MHNLLFNLLIFWLVSHFRSFHVLVPVSAKVFLSINCGSSSSELHTDIRSIAWVGDNQYVKTGQARNVIAKDIPDGWDSHVMSTLREFPNPKRNCYSIDVNNDNSEDNTKIERVLVRASFYYGNYDNKSDPPSFQIKFNGNYWDHIDTSMTGIVYKEVVYSLNHGNTVTICLSRALFVAERFVPFISALELRSLDSDTYGYVDSNYPLFFMSRIAYATNTIVRYPEDSYDRIWESVGSLGSTSGLIRVRNNSPFIEVNGTDKVPEALFTTTLMVQNIDTGPLRILRNITYSENTGHFNAYFSEVIKLNSTQKRSFNITVYTHHLVHMHDDFVDNLTVNQYGTVIPPYGHALQVPFKTTTGILPSRYEIFLNATDDSSLPPLINALEEFIIGDNKLVQGTNSKDVNSLALLQKSFPVLQDWLGDPCLPSPQTWYSETWEWVICDYSTDSPRVIALYLNDSGLVGTLPDFSAMDALRVIDLHNNSLTQPFPDFLATFPNLVVLKVADNNFSGTVPYSILNNTNLKFIASGNPNLPINKNTSVDRNSTGSRISSSSNNKNSIISTIPIIVLGSSIIQTLVYNFGLLM